MLLVRKLCCLCCLWCGAPRGEAGWWGGGLQKTREGDGKLAALAKEAGLQAGAFLEPDPELDPPDLPSAAAWLKTEELQAIPL